MIKIRSSGFGSLMTEAKGSITANQLKELDKLTAKDKLTPNQAIALTELEIKRDAPPKLSDTAKTFIDSIWIQDKYNRKNEVSTKEMTKGIVCEDVSIDLISGVDGTIYFKNEKHFDNEFITGTPDIICRGINKVIDIKTSWDIFTFHKAELTKIYEWQLKCYMYLLGFEKAELIYCLVSAPDYYIQKEIDSLPYKYPFNLEVDFLQEKQDQVYLNMTFEDMPEADRVKRFEVVLNDGDIETIQRKVIQANEYYKTIKL